MYKRCCKQGFHLSEHFQKTLHCEKDRRIQVPCQPSGRRVIPFGLKTDQHNPSGQLVRSVRTSPLYREGSVQVTSVRTPLSTQSVSEFFPSSKKGKFNQPSGRCGTPPDACLFNARIAIQISPSGRQLALFRTRVQRIWKLPIRLQPSRRQPVMVRTRA